MAESTQPPLLDEEDNTTTVSKETEKVSQEENKEENGVEEISKCSKLSTYQERLKKLKELHLKRNEARKLNHQEVVEEDRKKKLPSNFESKQKRVEWELAEAKARKEAEDQGEDYDRLKMLEQSAEDLEKAERRRKRKQNPDTGFSGFAQATFRQYQRLTRQMNPDVESYEKQKQDLGDRVYAGPNTILIGESTKPSEEAIDRMVEDVERQASKRAKFSRRREFRVDADVDYINERNRKFNDKAGRYYNKYTAEIKQNLERGTAL